MMPLSFTPTEKESLFADRILSKANNGIKPELLVTAKLDAESAVDILLGTKLSPQTLSWIWSEVDVGRKGYLSRQEVCAALRIVGWVQSGKKPSTENLLEKVGPLAVISGFDIGPHEPSTSPPPPKPSLPSFPSRGATVEDLAQFKTPPQSPTSNSSISSPPAIPSISRASVTRADTEAWNISPLFVSQAHKLFDAADKSQQGSIHMNEVLPLFQKASLPADHLATIWSLLGVKQSGQVTKDNFVGAIFLVYRCLTGLELPESLPESFVTAFVTPPPPPAGDPFSNLPSSSSADEEDEIGGLYAQIQALQDALLTLGQENDDLRSSVQTLHRISRQQTHSHNRMSRNVDVGLTEIAQLQVELQEKDSALTRLRASLQVTEDLSRENTLFRLEIEDLRTQLEISRGEAAAQTLVAEELARESDRLKRQVDEFRETSTQVPSSTDQEVQNLINEDLSRENSRLRSQARELQGAITQLQMPVEEMESLKETTRRLTQANKHLHRRLREMESSASSQDELRRRVEDLNRENERLQRDLHQQRRRSTSNRQNSTDLPPPAYTDIAR
ncbi:hypothetical protein D9757_000311 [Collybiopsis confluens]|uniref:Uncharacterized protein n=1 Tax=Collybiopsis confluens TaxID=2823264 RepID=A0A8H5I2E9_9AGAR|nr:hypothetical protein D9757_000311 [Collybiopsis confluens]